MLAARMLAMCVLLRCGGGGGSASPATDAGQSLETGAMEAADTSRVPPPFDGLSSYCVVSAVRKDAKAFAARSAWVRDSYRLLAASALGRHPSFARQCPAQVYSHVLGLIDSNGASTSAVGAAHLHAAMAGVAPLPGATAEGLGVYPRFSLANHSCAPNAVNAKGPADGADALDNCLVLRALRPIAAGEEVQFDYLDFAAGKDWPATAVRRARLREHFGFDCACEACVDSRV